MKETYPLLISLLTLLGTSLVKADYRSDYESGFEQRRDLIVDYIADDYIYPGGENPYDGSDISDPEKYTGPKMLARFFKYGPTDSDGITRGTWDINNRDRINANTIFDESVLVESNPTYGNLFHFRFVAPAYALHRWPEAPSVSENGDKYLGLPDATGVSGGGQGGFVFYRKDNYNAFTGEGTENHINMNRTSGYLYALYAINNEREWPMEDSHYNEMRQWLLDWSKRIYEVGTGEWDSSTYAAFNNMGWLNIFWVTGPNGPEYARDADVHAAAKAVLDFYATSQAIKLSQNMMGGGESRANRTYSRFNDATSYLNWLWFSNEEETLPEDRKTNAIYAIYGALSDYRPPMIAVKLARGEIGVPSLYHNSKPSYLLKEPSIGKEVYYRHDKYSLGSVNLKTGGYAASTWQIVPWKLMAFSDGDFPDVVWGNGGYFGTMGNTREPFTQHVQHKNVLIQMNRVPTDAQSMVDSVYGLYPGWVNDWRTDFYSRFSSRDLGGWSGGTPINSQSGTVANALKSAVLFPSSASKAAGQEARYIKVNDTYVAIISIRGSLPSDNGQNFTDSASYDQLFGLILDVGSTLEFNSFADFQSQMETHLAGGALDLSKRDSDNQITYTSLAGDVITATYATSGSWKEMDYDWVYGVTQDGGITTMHTADWEQPAWPSGANQGRQPTYSVNGKEMIDGEPWPVIDGPNATLKNSVLHLTDGVEDYIINYSGDIPVFSSAEVKAPLSSITNEDGKFYLNWSTEEGVQYSVLISLNLTSWIKFGPTVTGTGSSMSKELGSLSANPRTFWRVRAE